PERAVVQERRDYSWIGIPTGGRPASPATVRYQARGETRVAGYAPIPHINWTVVVERPEQVILAPARRAWHLALVGLGTSTGLALVMAVVLPSGHTPPDAQGNTRPNDAEIPENLRPMVQSLANIPAPTPSIEQAIRIQIPAIQIDAPVVQGVGWEQLKKGVGQLIGSADPGQSGNVVLSAHNDVYGELFRYLDKLQPGDQVILYTQQRQYVYIVDRTQVVEPTAVEVMASTGAPTVTLISCYPYLIDNQRIVVFARLQN
ncbi:MAG: sortase, partial [Chloroflexi bacterium]|nr:sortase [Chloroflexota bacterium]